MNYRREKGAYNGCRVVVVQLFVAAFTGMRKQYNGREEKWRKGRIKKRRETFIYRRKGEGFRELWGLGDCQVPLSGPMHGRKITLTIIKKINNRLNSSFILNCKL